MLHHCWKKVLNARAAAKQICGMKGEGVLSKSTAIEWFKRLEGGDANLEKKSHSGRPSTMDKDALLQAVQQQPCASTRRLSTKLGPSKSTIARHLHQLDFVNKRSQKVPHEQTP